MSHTATSQALTSRADGKCEICDASGDLAVHTVSGGRSDAEMTILICGVCGLQLGGTQPLNPDHWRCLQSAIWSAVPAVQVITWRLLHHLSTEGWAKDLFDQMSLEPEVLEWARTRSRPPAEEVMTTPTLDANGTELEDGDSVTLIKDLDVKGTTFVAKRGTLVKNIRLTDDPALVDGRVNKVAIVLKTCFLKKAV